MSKLDLRKELKRFYSAKKKPEVIDVPPGNFLSIVGKGEPGGEAYSSALQALYGLSYALKFKCKAEGRDFTVMALEGLWWWDDPSIFALENAIKGEGAMGALFNFFSMTLPDAYALYGAFKEAIEATKYYKTLHS